MSQRARRGPGRDQPRRGAAAHQGQQGIEQVNAKKVITVIKDAKLKVDASINGDKLRVTGKKPDDLQLVIALLRAAVAAAV